MKVWAFNKVVGDNERRLVYESINNGKSRFGWSQKDDHNLKRDDRPTEWNSKQNFLLRINAGDWIVHINTPEWGKCVAAKVLTKYDFDEGLKCSWGADFRHFFNIDIDSIVEFDRNDSNILPTVNLRPLQRQHRIYAVDDFIKSMDNIKNNRVEFKDNIGKGEFYLKQKTELYFSKLTNIVQEMHRAKDLEIFLAKVFRRIPEVVEVKENGFGWGTDYGADLILTTQSTIANLVFENKVIVQIKSYTGKNYDLGAVEQVKIGMEKYEASAGIIITTAERTEILENRIQEISNETNKQISLIAGDDVAKFIIKNAPDLIFKLDIM